MLSTVAVRGYRSLRDVTLPLGRLTVITGANGTGKSSVYRALRLLADCGRGEAIGALAREGGLQSARWAGAVTRNRPAELELGYAADDFGYLVDLGLPQMAGIDSMFDRDPEIKREVVFAGGVLRPGSTLVRRAGPLAEMRAESGSGFDELTRALPTYRSVLAEFADPGRLPELAAVRDRLARVAVLRRLPGRRHRAGTPTPRRHPHTGARRRRCRPRRRHPDDRRSGFRRPAPRGRRRLRRRERCRWSSHDGLFDVQLRQPGVHRPLRTAELSDGTLRFLLWAAALLSPQPPSLMVLNEPETSLHPDLVGPLAGLIRSAAQVTQVVVVTHSRALLELLGDDTVTLELVKNDGETRVAGQGLLSAPAWHWGSR